MEKTKQNPKKTNPYFIYNEEFNPLCDDDINTSPTVMQQLSFEAAKLCSVLLVFSFMSRTQKPGDVKAAEPFKLE